MHHPAVTAVQLNMLGSHDTPRLRTLCGDDLDSVRLAFLAQLTLPGAPCIYYGDEIGMSGGADPDCRAGFPRDPSLWAAGPHDWLVDLIGLRHSSRALRDGDLALLDARGMAAAYVRAHQDDAFAVVLNAGEEPLSWELALPLYAEGAEVMPLRGSREPGPQAELRPEAGARQTVRVGLAARDGTVIQLPR
jgi:cyclomaltodextrinase / maltogenic alpha-amylase / neopullulanase